MRSIVSIIVDSLKSIFWCDHAWAKPRIVADYDLRAGYEHKSVVMTCSKCGRHRTFTGTLP